MLKRKNVVVVMTDDQGYWTLGCYGNKEAHTPNIDALAEKGIRYDNFFCASPVCSPARASFLTGNIPSAHGITDWLMRGNLDPSKSELFNAPKYAGEEPVNYLEGQMTYTDILHENGYTCALSGKWHMGNSTEPQHGFTKWFTMPQGDPMYKGPIFIEGDRIWREDGYSTDFITKRGVEFIRELAPKSREEDAPFYLSVHYTAPHAPWMTNMHLPKWTEYFKHCTFDEIPFEPHHPNIVFSQEAPYFRPNVTEEELMAYRHDLLCGYYSAIAAVDEGVGDLVKALEEQGVLEDTIIVYTSDNGMNAGHHGVWGKGNGTFPQNMFDTSVKIPFILYDPSAEGNGTPCGNLYSHYDFFPTLVEKLDLKLTEEEREKLDHLPGESFCGKETEDDRNAEKAVILYSEYGPVRMIRTREWKYIHCYPHGPNELYDLVNDPGEKNNLINDPAQKERIYRMKWQLENWFVKYVDPRKDSTKDNNVGKGQIYKNGADSDGRESFFDPEFVHLPYEDFMTRLSQEKKKN